MKRRAMLATLAAAALPLPAAADVGVELRTPTGTLAGSLIKPLTGKPPVVLIVAGSGPTDRDGNSALGLRAAPYRLLAAALFARGIASVRYDKRGIAASAAAGPSEAALRFDDLVADAAAWVEQLDADASFSRVGVVGHSEGSLIGMLAAQRGRCAAFVSLAGAAMPAAQEIRRQTATGFPDPALEAANRHILDELNAGRTVADVPPALAPLYRPSVQSYLIGWFRYDPLVEIAKLAIPSAIVQGTNDLQIPVTDARALAAAQPKARLVIVEGMTHLLKIVPATTLVEQLRTAYTDPSIPIAPVLPEVIAQIMQG
jgi:pimeloyl-ACP methyl ester carboxylesterase